jgi:hypothetical protein
MFGPTLNLRGGAVTARYNGELLGRKSAFRSGLIIAPSGTKFSYGNDSQLEAGGNIGVILVEENGERRFPTLSTWPSRGSRDKK